MKSLIRFNFLQQWFPTFYSWRPCLYAMQKPWPPDACRGWNAKEAPPPPNLPDKEFNTKIKLRIFLQRRG